MLTDATTRVDCSSLHKFMASTRAGDWGIGILQYCEGLWCVAVRERAWWYQLRWAVNDLPLGILGIPDPTTLLLCHHGVGQTRKFYIFSMSCVSHKII